MRSTVSVAMVGICGYGDSYLAAMLTPKGGHPRAADGFELVGAVDPNPQRCRHLNLLRQRHIPIHPDLDSLYADTRPDLVMMATPIHLHAAHTCAALAAGSSVLCEKPAGATLDDARRMLAAERLAGSGFVAIGYQWSFSRAIRKIKRDILAGDFGAAVRLKTIACFPRGINYFKRNDWAGRIRTAEGAPVYDSPANNATAHYLHNMLYLLGPRPELSARPVSVQAELYRANDIENYDTAAIRCITDGGAELLFYTSHAMQLRMGPVVRYEFERAVLYYEPESHGGFVARFHDGSMRRYGDPNVDRHRKIWKAIDAVRQGRDSGFGVQGSARDGDGERRTVNADGTIPIPCGVRAASAHTLCVSAAQASMPQIRDFPEALIFTESLGDGVMKCVNGLAAAFVQCYDQGILPAEHGALDWAARGEVIDLRQPQWRLDGEAAVETWVAPWARSRTADKARGK